MLRRFISVQPSILRQTCRSFSSQPKLVNVEVNDKTGIATVTLNRPPVNSLNLELLTDLSKTLDEILDNRSKGMILTSVRHLKLKSLSLNNKILSSLVFKHCFLSWIRYYGNV